MDILDFKRIEEKMYTLLLYSEEYNYIIIYSYTVYKIFKLYWFYVTEGISCIYIYEKSWKRWIFLNITLTRVRKWRIFLWINDSM